VLSASKQHGGVYGRLVVSHIVHLTRETQDDEGKKLVGEIGPRQSRHEFVGVSLGYRHRHHHWHVVFMASSSSLLCTLSISYGCIIGACPITDIVINNLLTSLGNSWRLVGLSSWTEPLIQQQPCSPMPSQVEEKEADRPSTRQRRTC
jgi:hypothetical protein